MVDRIDMTWNVDYWDGLARIKNYNGVCWGFHTKEQFYGFTEPVEDLKPYMKFLDFGCGPGRIVKTVAPHVQTYVGVDVSEGLLEMAREHHKSYSNVSFVKCNGTDLSCFEDNTFDYIYERLVFIHVPKEGIVKYIKEFFRVLRPGGFLYIPDLPKEEACTNGFTMAEMEMFRDFGSVNVSAIGYDNNPGVYMVKCVK